MVTVLGQVIPGRGVTKNAQTSAQMNGLVPQNPQFFGLQQRNPIPYQTIVANGRNLSAVMQGFQETAQGGGVMPEDAAQVVAQMKRKRTLISEAFDHKSRDSIYAGVPRTAAVNLYNINLKNIRENSIYAFQ